jgi:hypothetical protein
LTPDAAHQPALCYVPFLLTGDPYYLEQMQFMASWNELWRPWQYRYRTTQVRGEAWSLRTWAQVAKVTPANVPKWLVPRAQWQKLLDSYLDFYMKTFVTSNETPRAIFRTTDWEFGDNRDGLLEGTYVSTWMEEFLAAVLGWMVLMGYQEWHPVFEWKVGSTLARTDGKSGWVRAFCTPYRMVMRENNTSPWAQNWKQAFDLTAKGLHLETSDPDRLVLAGQLFYVQYTRGALVLAKHVGLPNVDASLTWADDAVAYAQSAGRALPHKWAFV